MPETPPRPHRTPSPGESLVEWRVGALEDFTSRMDRKLDKILENQQRKEESHIQAVERCARHGEDIVELKAEVAATRKDPVAFWTAIGAAVASVGTAIGAFFHKGSP